MKIRKFKNMEPKILPRHSIFLLSAFLLLLAGCQPTSTPTEMPSTEESVTIATPTPEQVVEEPSLQISADIFLDPALAQDEDSLRVSQYLYEGLVRLSGSGNPQPALAESWVISDDQLDYIFTLRPGLVFSDGTPITPDVIVENFNRWFDPQSSLRGNGDYLAWGKIFLGFHGERDAENRAKSTVDGIQKVDINTVLVHLNRPVPDLLIYLADPAFAILNPTMLASGGYGGRDSTIVSSGPYVVSAWTDTGLVLSPNPRYWENKPAGDLNFTWR